MFWQDRIRIREIPDNLINNSELSESILALPVSAYERRSHFFHGRYENLYLSSDKIPGLGQVLDFALRFASEILQQPIEKLKLGFWLNIMRQGDVTSLHSHDDDDEILSAVYYVQVPDESGFFRFHESAKSIEIQPVTGRYMFFDPALPHDVTAHNNHTPRISIGMNIGLSSEIGTD